MDKIRLLGKTPEEIKEITSNHSLPGFAAKQISDWMYRKNAATLEEMTNLSKEARIELGEQYSVGWMPPHTVQESSDGTRKYLLPTETGRFVEAVYIPDNDRHTLCVSTQSGCMRHCKFCMTGLQGLHGNCTAGDILNQIYAIPESQKLTNLVFMGMGEPLDNLENVLRAIEVLTADYGRAWSPKRITVSTVGVIPSMVRFLEEANAHLALSVHNPFSDERKKMMPVERQYPVEKVVEEVKKADLGRQRKFSVEYIMFDGLNDTDRHVDGLAKLLNGLRCRINLIRYHTVPGNDYHCSPMKRVEEFKEKLIKKGFRVTIRKSRGEDISAACGMLSTKENNG